MTNMMIQNSISQKQQVPNNNLKQEPAQHISYEARKVGAAPYEAKGHLVENPVWKAPIVAVQDSVEDIKNIGRGLKGDSDDHRLGRMNDVAMKAGGLAIASYLATTRVLPVKKGMEFVGFASFVAAMGLSKVLIDAPVKALYGFNNNQKYVDSQGRKKPFFTDPQYIPWDIVPAEEINRVGDKMKIDPNMDNREDLIKEKMTKIATQSNTMWMLTAGITTPIIGALMSSQIEKGLGVLQEKKETARIQAKLGKLEAELSNANQIAEDKKDQKGLDALKAFLKKHKDNAVEDNFADQAVELMYKGNDLKLKANLKLDVKNIMEETPINNVAEFLGDIEVKVPSNPNVENSEMVTHKFSKEAIKGILEGKNGQQNINQNFVPKNENIQNKIIARLSSLANNELNERFGMISLDAEDPQSAICSALKDKFGEEVNNKLAKAPKKLTEDKSNKMEAVFNAIDNFRVKKGLLDEFVNYKIGDNEGSMGARNWKKTSESIMKAIGFSDKELKLASKSPATARDLLESKMVAISQDENKYKKVIGKIAEAVNKFDNEMDKGALKNGNGFLPESKKMTEAFHDEFASKATASSFTNVADYIGGNGEKGLIASAKTNAIALVENNITGAKSSFYRVIQGFDAIRRLEIAKGENKLDEKTAKTIKHIVLNNTYGDYFVKNDIADKEEYQKVMNHIFTDTPDKVTEEALKAQNGRGTLLSRIKATTLKTRQQLCDVEYKFKKGHTLEYVDNMEVLGDTSKQMMTGQAISKFAQETAGKMHNTKSWLKMFGGIGAGVAAIAMISPVFFGKVKAPKQKKEVSYDA
jgi:hypothetical protein